MFRHVLISFIIAACCLSQGVSAQEHKGGLIFDDALTYKNFPRAAKIDRWELVPGKKDMSLYFPPPGDQGKQFSCVGWAVAYTKSYYENIERIQDGNKPQMYSPSFIYNSIKKTSSCDSGARVSDALNRIRDVGAMLLKDFPYDPTSTTDCSKQPTPSQLTVAESAKNRGWATVDINDTRNVQMHLLTGTPIIIGTNIYENFLDLKKETYNSIQGKLKYGHAMVIVGYDQSRGAYKLINSWGQEWGDGGYGWVDYNTLRSMMQQNAAYIMYDASQFNGEWDRYQACLSSPQPVRCCDHLSINMYQPADLCKSVTDRMGIELYNQCIALGKPRCCDHLSKEQATKLHVCGF